MANYNLQCHILSTITQFLNTCLHDEEEFCGRNCTCSLFLFFSDNLHEKTFSFIIKFPSCSKIMSLLIIFLVFNCFQQRLRADINFLSIVSAWQITCCETEIVFKDE